MPNTPGPVSLTNKQVSSNLFQLPCLSGMTFSITTNGGWYDTIYFTQSPSSTIPIDLSGISFHAELRTAVGDARNALNMSTLTNPPQLVNGQTQGALYFSVDASLLVNLTPGQYVMDILATDTASGMVRNLCEPAPIVVTVFQGVTR
jgi:hypothetical protein